MAATRVPSVGVHDDRPAHEPVSQPRGLGPQREVGLLAVGEVALVEQAHLLEQLAAGEHQRAVRVAGRLPALGHGGRREDAAEVRVDDRRGAVAEVGAGQAGPGPRGHGLEHAGQAVRARARRRAGASPTQSPSSACGWASTCRNPALAPGPKPAVAGQRHERDAVGQPGSQRRRPASGVEPLSTTTTRTPPGTSWARNRATVARHRSARFQWTITTGSTGLILADRRDRGARWGDGHAARPGGPRPARLHRRLAVAVPRLRHRRGAPRGGRVRRARRDRRLAGRARPALRPPRRQPRGVGHRRRTTPRPAPFRIIGAHTDSPNLRVKPHPDAGQAGYRQLAVEVYGGALLNSWLDRDLGLSGPGRRARTARGAERAPAAHRPPAPPRPAAGDPPRPRDQRAAGCCSTRSSTSARSGASATRRPAAFAAFVADAARRRRRRRPRLGPHGPRPHARHARRRRRRAHRARRGSTTSARRGPGSSALLAVAADAATAAPSPGARAVRPRGDRLDVRPRRRVDAAARPSSSAIVAGLGGGREDLLRALAGSLCALGRHGPRHPPELRRPPRARPPHRAQRRPGAQGEQQPALRHRRRQRAPRSCSPASRPACRYQRYAHRSDLPCGSTIGPITAAGARHPHLRRRRAAAGDALGPRARAARTTRRTTPPPWPRSSPLGVTPPGQHGRLVHHD